MQKVAVIDYGMGNLCSVLKAWESAGAESRLVFSASQVKDDDIIVFPGQGAIADSMKLLNAKGFTEAIREWIAADRPFFGICLGMQALFEFSEEGGGVECIGAFKGSVKKMNLPKGYKIPHMGWDNVDFSDKHPAYLKDIRHSDQFYFVHSYYLDTPDTEIIYGKTTYGGLEFTSAVAKGRILATQFHPEKSQTKGLQLYKNFLELLG